MFSKPVGNEQPNIGRGLAATAQQTQKGKGDPRLNAALKTRQRSEGCHYRERYLGLTGGRRCCSTLFMDDLPQNKETGAERVDGKRSACLIRNPRQLPGVSIVENTAVSCVDYTAIKPLVDESI